MATCDVLDIRCIFVSEIVGNAILAMIILMIFYFVVASRLNWGFKTTVGFLFPIILIGGLAITEFSAIFAFTTILVGLMYAWIINRIIGNR